MAGVTDSPVIIEAAVNGAMTRERQPQVPRTPREVADDALSRLAAIARERPRALHAPRLLNSDGSVQRSAHPRPGTAGASASNPPSLPVAPPQATIGAAPKPAPPAKPVVPPLPTTRP